VTPVRNAVGWRERFARLRGAPIDRDLSRFDAALAAIAGFERELLWGLVERFLRKPPPRRH